MLTTTGCIGTHVVIEL